MEEAKTPTCVPQGAREAEQKTVPGKQLTRFLIHPLLQQSCNIADFPRVATVPFLVYKTVYSKDKLQITPIGERFSLEPQGPNSMSRFAL